MRVFWLTLLATGLLLVAVETYETVQSDPSEMSATFGDDGSGMPTPSPTPVTK